jgi:hypothetical protein
VVLAGAAGTGAYLVTRQVLTKADAPTSTASTQPTITVTVPGLPTGPQTTPRATTDAKDPATFCPAITEKAVTAAGLAGGLVLLRYVQASATGLSDAEAWICKNSDGVLIYQGHRKSGPFDAATGDNTILLARGILGKVDTEGNDGFVATNPKDPANLDDPAHTEYHVSAKAFFHETSPGGARSDYKIVRTVPTG